VPQDVLDCDAYGSHVPVTPPVQQPRAQVVESHAQAPLFVSQRPCAQVWHAAPPAPHALADCDEYAMHEPLAVQQPPGHEVASQTQAPVLVSHSWPEAHAAQLAPPVPHEEFDSEA
jgi:hypothetical protein